MLVTWNDQFDSTNKIIWGQELNNIKIKSH